MLYIDTLIKPSGHTLYNVPADINTLVEMGFEANKAKALYDEAYHKHYWNSFRQKRNERLRLTDWTQLPDTLLRTKEEKKLKEQFKIYRQRLREIPQTYSNPNEVVWPDIPKL
ncbi:phage tail assembly chaperone [Spartinivicinus poritis]|uniref:Phage tail assembly chaperone n=1 Tax=Spartinivicinus poritis TaxID=2994640 RepID=A0ABT5UBJ3_9GAMM|nr:phage tail assembly chaperone [Spartinivicinus sp. A2-2]MDE1463351.1 phage tail assembly chaperone [Spartinivicinus sp. A2-2]